MRMADNDAVSVGATVGTVDTVDSIDSIHTVHTVNAVGVSVMSIHPRLSLRQQKRQNLVLRNLLNLILSVHIKQMQDCLLLIPRELGCQEGVVMCLFRRP